MKKLDLEPNYNEYGINKTRNLSYFRANNSKIMKYSFANIKNNKPENELYSFASNPSSLKGKPRIINFKTDTDSYSPRLETPVVNNIITNKPGYVITSIPNPNTNTKNVRINKYNNGQSINIQNSNQNSQSGALQSLHKQQLIEKAMQGQVIGGQLIINSARLHAHQPSSAIQQTQYSKIRTGSTEYPKGLTTTLSSYQRSFAKGNNNEGIKGNIPSTIATTTTHVNPKKSSQFTRNIVYDNYCLNDKTPVANNPIFEHTKNIQGSIQFKKQDNNHIHVYDIINTNNNNDVELPYKMENNNNKDIIKKSNCTTTASSLISMSNKVKQMNIGSDNVTCISIALLSANDKEKVKQSICSPISNNSTRDPNQNSDYKLFKKNDYLPSSLTKLPLSAINATSSNNSEEIKTNDLSYISISNNDDKGKSKDNNSNKDLYMYIMNENNTKQSQFQKDNQEEEKNFLELYNLLSSKLKQQIKRVIINNNHDCQ